MDLKPTRLEYEFKGKDGYSFTVVCEWENGKGHKSLGWRATVEMTTHGLITPEAAVEHLRHSAEAFLRQVPEESP